MKLIRNAGVGALVGIILWIAVAQLFTISFGELIIFALIGMIVGVAVGGVASEEMLTLGGLQEIIDRGEYNTNPKSQWYEEVSSRREAFFCQYDGTIWAKPASGCPSPYHPYPLPRKQNRGMSYLAAGSACLAFIYSVVTNEALVTLIVTFLLLIISAVIFTALFVVLMSVSIKLARSLDEIRIYKSFLDVFLSLGSNFSTMILVSLIREQFPDITWWLIEFAISYAIQAVVSSPVTIWLLRRSGRVTP